MHPLCWIQWRSQVIGIGRAPAVRKPFSLAVARTSHEIARHERDEHGTLAGHVPAQAHPSLRHWLDPS